MKSFKYLVSGLLLSLLCCSGIFAQTIGVNTDGSLPATLFHTKNTTAGEDNILRIENTIGNRETGINLLNSTTANANWKFYVPASSNALRLYNGSDLFSVMQNGNVGIGTTSPRAKLDVAGAVMPSYAASTLANKNSGLIWQSGTNVQTAFGFVVQEGVWYQSDNNAINRDFGVRGPTVDGSLGTINFVVRGDNGNVGIGTTNPGAKLDVNGSISASSVGAESISSTVVTSSEVRFPHSWGSFKIRVITNAFTGSSCNSICSSNNGVCLMQIWMNVAGGTIVACSEANAGRLYDCACMTTGNP